MRDTDIPALPSEKVDIAERYLDRMLAKVESAKVDVEKNWLLQITSIAISLALVAGLGTAIATKLLSDPHSSNFLYVVFPLVNTYFFVRFGLIGGVFSKARFSAERLAEALAPHHRLEAYVDTARIYETNSYFEWAHQEPNRATMPFLFTIPIVFALNHALTIYLGFKVLGSSPAFYLCLAGYVLIVSTCYWSYYDSNKGNTVAFVGERKNSFIIVAVATALVATAALLWALFRYDPNPGRIDFSADPPGRSAAHSDARAPSPAP